MADMKTFTYQRTQGMDYTIHVDEEEMEIVCEVLPHFTTKTQAITYLHLRGWSTKDICNIIRYDDGRPLLAPHVNQVRAKARASRVTEVMGYR